MIDRDDILATTVAFSAIGSLAGLGLFDSWESQSLSWRFALRGTRESRAPIAIVALDEAALARFGQMPWDRGVFGTVLDQLRDARVAVAVFDIAFSEPGRSRPGEDEDLARAMRRFRRVILPVHRPLQSGPAQGGSLVGPIAGLREAAAGFGLAQFGVQGALQISETELQAQIGRLVVPTLGIAAARNLGARSTALESPRMALDFLGPPGTIKTISAGDIFDGHFSRGSLKDHAVFIGATAAGLPDTGFAGAFGGPMAGVEIHATVAENAFSRGGLRRLPTAASWGLWLLLGAASLPLAARRNRLRRTLLCFSALMAGIAIIVWFAFMWGWWVSLIAPATVVGTTAMVGRARQEADTLRERSRLLTWYAQDVNVQASRERERIDGELHDQAQQQLVVMDLEIQKLARVLGHNDLTAPVAVLCTQLREEILRVRKALVPKTLERDGLLAATYEMAADTQTRTGIDVAIQAADWPADLGVALESDLFWFIREALNNAQKYANATRIDISLCLVDKSVLLEVADNGEGFRVGDFERPPEDHEKTGLHRLWVRTRTLEGDLRIHSAPGMGCKLVFKLPNRHPVP